MTNSSEFCNIEASFRQCMRDAGLEFAGEIVADGVLHRFKADGEHNPDSWYVLHSDGVPTGIFGNWKTGVEGTWSAKPEQEFTKAEKAVYRKNIADDKAKRDADQAKRHAEAATLAQTILDAAQPATATDDPQHPYLSRKLASPYPGIRVGDWPQRQAKNCLLVPFAIDDRLTTIEAIAATGSLIGDSGKDWLAGGEKRGASFQISRSENSELIIFSEGYSTGASIYEATGWPVVVCGDAGNLIHVAKRYRAKYATKRFFFAADNDIGKDTNRGLKDAKAASQAVSGHVVMPDFTDQEIADWQRDHTGKFPTDFNDLRVIRGLDGVKAVFDAALVVINNEPKPSKDSLLVRTDAKGNASLLNHNEAAALLYREEFKELLHFDPVVCDWYQYQTTGIFKIRPDLSIQQAIYRAIVRHRGDLGFSASYVASVAKCLMFESVRESDRPSGKICFLNGVLELESRQLLEHSPKNFFTSQLPFEWQPKAPDPQLVINWLKEATGGHNDQVQLLRAWFHAVIIGRPDLQRFLEVVGFGGSGKGTLIRLCMAIVGREATHSTMLGQLETNRFETAKIFNKRLVVITDAEKWHGDVSVLKSITGQDPIRFEEKNKQSGDSFTFGGMVLIASNQHNASTDYSSGIQRRRITVLFDHVVPADKRRDLDSEFEPLLSGVVRWSLDMPENEVTAYLRNTLNRVASLKSVRIESLTATNPIAGWLMDSVDFNESMETQIGVKETLTKTSSGSDCDKITIREYAHWKTRLYPNYCTWCDRSGKQPIGIYAFGRTVVDVCRNMLGKPFVEKKRQGGTGINIIKGVSLRNFCDGFSDGFSDEYIIDCVENDGCDDVEKISDYGKAQGQPEDRQSGKYADPAVDQEVCEKVCHNHHNLNNQEVIHHKTHHKSVTKPVDDDVEYF